jgi:hypothetical protein
MALVSSSPSFLQRIGETSAAVRVVDYRGLTPPLP